jgi:hypothetical protein
MKELTFDLTDCFECLKAESKGSNVLILRKLLYPKKGIDGNERPFRLEHRWLSKSIECEQDIKDQNYVCVLGNDFSLWNKEEFDLEKSLFEQFDTIS